MTPEDSVWQPQRRTKVTIKPEKRPTLAPLAAAAGLLLAYVVLHAISFACDGLVVFAQLDPHGAGLLVTFGLPLATIGLGAAGQYLCLRHTPTEAKAVQFVQIALGLQAGAVALALPFRLGWTPAWVGSVATFLLLCGHVAIAVYVRQLALHLEKFQLVKDSETVLAYTGGLVLLVLLSSSGGAAALQHLRFRHVPYIMIANVVFLVYAGAVVFKYGYLLRDLRYELLQYGERPR